MVPTRGQGRVIAPVLVHDYLLVHRGAERTFAAMAECWPEAPISTLLYDEEVMGRHLRGHDVRTSALQRLGVDQGSFRRLLPLFPLAAERLQVGGHDVVLSSSSAFALGVRPDPGAVHLCYCYTPFRYAHHERQQALAEVPRLARPALAATLGGIRRWDRRAADRVTQFIAISETSRERIARAYGRDAEIIHPPVETRRFSATAEVEDFFLIVCELVRHKRVEVALEAARLARVPIKVVGDGPDRERLEARHGDHAEFLGRLSDEELAALYPRARALVVPNVEEFGIAAVESQAAGRPVIAPAAGGTLETVIDGETGVLLDEVTPEAIAEVMRQVDFGRFSRSSAVLQAEQFSTPTFQRRLRAFVEAAVPLDVPTSAAGVTVVVPAWGPHVAYVPDAVASLQEQEGPDLEIVVVDNASDVPVPPLPEGVRVVRTAERLPVGGARNAGLLEARTPYVMFWDADDLMLPGSMARLAGVLDDEPGTVAVTMDSLRWRPETGPGERWPWPRAIMYGLADRPRLFAIISQVYCPYTTTGPALMRTAAVQDAGGFSEDIAFFEDWALAAALTVRGRVRMLRETARLYRIHDESLTLGHLGHPDEGDWLRGLRHRTRADHRAPLWLKGLQPLVLLHHAHRTRMGKRASGGIGFYEATLEDMAGSATATGEASADSARPAQPERAGIGRAR